MDLSKWSMDEIMQLPDHCFGRRWWIGGEIQTDADATTYFVFEENLPDNLVVWEVLISAAPVSAGTTWGLTLRLCNVAPTAVTILGMRRLLPGMGNVEGVYDVVATRQGSFEMVPMRCLVESAGDKIGGALTLVLETLDMISTVGVLISSVPRSVPDCLISGRL